MLPLCFIVTGRYKAFLSGLVYYFPGSLAQYFYCTNCQGVKECQAFLPNLI